MDMISYLLGYSTGAKRGGSGGGGDAGGWVSASGYFEPSSSSAAVTVEHNMGVKPDIVVVCANGMPTTHLSIFMLSGVSSAVIDKGVTGSNVTKLAIVSQGTLMTIGVNSVIDRNDNMLTTYGFPRDLTTTEFKVGGGSIGLLNTGMRYDWFAIGGIT